MAASIRLRSPKPTGIGKCQLCPRYAHTQVICMPGFGSKTPELVIIAESPSTVEDTWCRVCFEPQTSACRKAKHDRGVPLTGPSGQIMRRILADLGIDPSQVFMTNVSRCSGGTPKPQQVRTCVNAYLIEELAGLDYSHCRAVVLCGEIAVRGFLNRSTLKITQSRRRVLDQFGPKISTNGEQRLLVPVALRSTYHPAAALPGRGADRIYKEILEDLQDLLEVREDPITTIEGSAKDLRKAFESTKVLGIDLEWDQHGPTLLGASDGNTTLVTTSVKEVLEWLSTGPSLQEHKSDS